MNISQGTVIGGKYRLERSFGAGGMGSVWLARHVTLQSEVAIKFMAPSIASSPIARMRFEREAMTAAQLSSDYIVKVHDYGIESGVPFIAMELLHGEDLWARLRREGRLSLKAASDLAAQVARGLRKLHEATIVHRDLKPHNIFIVRGDDEERVKLLDFGVAKRVGAFLDDGTQTGDFLGSPHYMSPEQIQDSRGIDSRSDLWSFAVILFRAVTGALPFPGSTAGAVLSKVLCDPVPSPSSLAHDLPPTIDVFFRRALTRDVEQRFQSARELADAFVAAAGCGARATLPSLVPESSRAQSPPDTSPAVLLGMPVAEPLAMVTTTIPILPPPRFDSKPEIEAAHLQWMREHAIRQAMNGSPGPSIATDGETLPLMDTQTNASATIGGVEPAHRRRRRVRLTLLALMAGAVGGFGFLVVGLSGTDSKVTASSPADSVTAQPIDTLHSSRAEGQPGERSGVHDGETPPQVPAAPGTIAPPPPDAPSARSTAPNPSAAPAAPSAIQLFNQKSTSFAQDRDASQRSKARPRKKCTLLCSQ